MPASDHTPQRRSVDPDLAVGEERGPEAPMAAGGRAHVPAAVLLAIAGGGVVGAVGRYLLSLALPTVTGRFPWGTWLTNVSGSAALGFALVVISERLPRSRYARPLIGTGLIGAYTTFSTFTVEAALLARAGDAVTGLVYLLASVLAGILAVAAGMALGRRLARPGAGPHDAAAPAGPGTS